VVCTKMLINAGINRVFVAQQYPDALSKELLNEAGVSIYLDELYSRFYAAQMWL